MGKDTTKKISWDGHRAYSSEEATRSCLTLRLTECTHIILYSEAINFSFGLTWITVI